MLNYTSTEINRNFLIKVSGLGLHELRGVRGFVSLIADDNLANRLLDRAFSCKGDKCECRLRRGLKVVFYAK